MALGRWTLVRQRVPGDARRRPVEALGLVPDVAVLPHFDRFGARWVESAAAGLPPEAILLGVDERTAAVWLPGEGWRAVGPGTVTISGAATNLADLPAPQSTP